MRDLRSAPPGLEVGGSKDLLLVKRYWLLGKSFKTDY
jgi:hypothetical protein